MSRPFLKVKWSAVRYLQRRCSSTDQFISITEARKNLMAIVGSPKSHSEDPDLSGASGQVRTTQDELPTRKMSDSYKEAVIQLGTDRSVRERYITTQQGIRFGRILEDLDTFAGYICYTHYKDPLLDPTKKSPIGIVTALVDRIELQNRAVSPYHDVKMSGYVSWTGKTSMEVTMNLEQEVDNTWNKVLKALFVMVARNPTTKKSAVINLLVPDNREEEVIFQKGEANKLKRQEVARTSLLKTPPSEEERLIIHDLFLKTIDPSSGTFKVRVKPEGTVWMENTLLKTLIVCQPEQRNIHNKIFGGFLMRQAIEIAWANAAIYCRKRPRLQIVDDIMFKKSVEIGSVVMLSSQIVYTNKSEMQIKVHAESLDITTGTREITNDFHFTFDSLDDNLCQVIPKTYAESMLYLDGKRHYES